MFACALRLLWRAYAVPGLPAHEALYQPILQGVIGYNYQAASALQHAHSLLQSRLQGFQLSIDGYSYGLKSTSGGVYSLAAAGNHLFYDLGQLQRRMHWPVTND